MPKNNYSDWIKKYARKYDLSPHLVTGLIRQESNFDPDAMSPAGAVGLCQFMKATAIDMGLQVDEQLDERLDPEKSIEACCRYLARITKWVEPLLEQYHTKLILAAYNAGIGNVRKYNGIPPFPETESYVDRVTRYAAEYEADAIEQSAKCPRGNCG